MAVPTSTGVPGRKKSLLTRFLQPRAPLIEPQSQGLIYVDNSKSPLLRLPGELRSLIWEYAFLLSTEERLQVVQYFPERRDASGLALTCKQIRQEIGQLPYLNAVSVVWPGAAWPQGHQRGWVDLPAGYILRWTNSLPPAVQRRPETVKCLALGFSLFVRNDSNPLDSLIDSDVLRMGGNKPTEFILKLCICRNPNRVPITPNRLMGFCISLERLAVHFPSLERIVIYYCLKGLASPTSGFNPDDFPKMVTSAHTIRSSSGAPWSVQSLPASHGKKVHLKWTAAPHPGQALYTTPWTSRTVAIDYYDSGIVPNTACLRYYPKPEAPSSPSGTSCSSSSSSSSSSPVLEESLLTPRFLSFEERDQDEIEMVFGAEE